MSSRITISYFIVFYWGVTSRWNRIASKELLSVSHLFQNNIGRSGVLLLDNWMTHKFTQHKLQRLEYGQNIWTSYIDPYRPTCTYTLMRRLQYRWWEERIRCLVPQDINSDTHKQTETSTERTYMSHCHLLRVAGYQLAHPLTWSVDRASRELLGADRWRAIGLRLRCNYFFMSSDRS